MFIFLVYVIFAADVAFPQVKRILAALKEKDVHHS